MSAAGTQQKPSPTLKQRRVIDLTKQELSKPTGTKKSKAQIIREAGYSREVSEKPELVYESKAVKDQLSTFISTLEKKRQKSLNAITDEKLKRANARDNAYITDILTKNHQLLTGGATENIAINLPNSVYERLLERERERIDADIIEEESKEIEKPHKT